VEAGDLAIEMLEAPHGFRRVGGQAQAMCQAQQRREHAAALQQDEPCDQRRENRQPSEDSPAHRWRQRGLLDDQGEADDDEGDLADGLRQLGDRHRGYERRGRRSIPQQAGAHEFAANRRRGGDVVDGVAGDARRQHPAQGNGRPRRRKGGAPAERVGRVRDDLLNHHRHDAPADGTQIRDHRVGPELVNQKDEEGGAADQQNALGMAEDLSSDAATADARP
jgi:hypothetical protein